MINEAVAIVGCDLNGSILDLEVAQLDIVGDNTATSVGTIT